MTIEEGKTLGHAACLLSAERKMGALDKVPASLLALLDSQQWRTARED